MQTINGKHFDNDGQALIEFLEQNGFEISRIAIELNGKILPKNKYGAQLLCDGDHIEIVSFVGGG
ncbi:MAG: sulfur carrier protein ThiS [Clostridia bacterium]